MDKPSKKRQMLYQHARSLFSQYGWTAVSIEQICAAADVSRVTFYKYFDNKKTLLKEVVLQHIYEVRTEFLRLAQEAENLAEVVSGMFDLQRQSMASVYSEAMRHDMSSHQDEELQQFFAELEREKYHFMLGFFQTLQRRKLIQADLPAVLMDAFIRQMDVLMHQQAVQAAYRDIPQQLPKDILHLLLYGLTARH